MKQKSIAILCLMIASAVTAFSQITLNTAASRSIGQPALLPETSRPNLVEGRELFFPQGIALDTSASPPTLYVADTQNNRVMVWKNANSFSNGQAADLIIGQKDQFSTDPGGGSTNTAGLSFPTGLAVLNGDLYVADTGNNRVLRFRAPLSKTTGNLFPDMWLGQTTIASNAPARSKTGLALAGNQVNLAFDTSGNLWVSDPGNNRVVRFPASSIACSNCGGQAADLVLGQPDFTTLQPALTTDPASGVIGNEFNNPSALAFDSSGNVYVSDSGAGPYPGRILIFSPPFTSGMSAAGIMGVFPPVVTVPPTTTQSFQTEMGAPNSIFFFPDGSIGVLDTGFNRILTFPAFSTWKGSSNPFSPQATRFYGQNDFITIKANGTGVTTPQATNSSLWAPSASAFNPVTKELFVAEANNNRVVVLPVGANSLAPAIRVLGQDTFSGNSPNLIEGREFNFDSSFNGNVVADAGIAIDNSGPTPHLYVADTYNNRVLGFKDLRTIQAGGRADIVIGQPNFTTALCNYNAADPNHGGSVFSPNQQSLCFPKGVLVDSKGNLYVTDTGNGRVLRFPSPFSFTGTLEPADLVLGQNSFTAQIPDATASTMRAPYGMAFSGTNGLFVSDQSLNRVLFIPFSANGTFAAQTDNGRAATKVYGQSNFTNAVTGASLANMNAPHHISSDTNGQLYVADTGNNRFMVFSDPGNPQTPAAGSIAGSVVGGFATPEGIYVNPDTGEIWVANTGSSTAVRFPQYSTLIFNQQSIGGVQDVSLTLAVAQDKFGDLVVADATNRISIYFPQLNGVNGANFQASKLLAPGLIATLFPIDTTVTFSSATAAYTDLPASSSLPTALADTQVLFNGTPVPLFYVSPTQVNFYVPNGAPTSGFVEVEVVQKSTGQVRAARQLPMNTVSPGIFVCGSLAAKVRQACVINQDNTVNSVANPAARGSQIAIYTTGLGSVPNAPPDGQQASLTTLLPAPVSLDVAFAGVITGNATRQANDPAKFIQFVGLAPGFWGLYQINVTIPLSAAIGGQVQLNLFVNGNIGEPDTGTGYIATVAIK